MPTPGASLLVILASLCLAIIAATNGGYTVDFGSSLLNVPTVHDPPAAAQSSVDGNATASRFDTPKSLSVAPDGVVFVLEKNKLRTMSPVDGSTWTAANANTNYDGRMGSHVDATGPDGLVYFTTGECCPNDGRTYKFDRSTNETDEFLLSEGTGGIARCIGQDVIIVADYDQAMYGNRILAYDSAGDSQGNLALWIMGRSGQPVVGQSESEGNVQFGTLGALAVNKHCTELVAVDEDTAQIVVFDIASLTITDVYGIGQGSTTQDGDPTTAQFDSPSDVSWAGANDEFIVVNQQKGSGLRVIDHAGTKLTNTTASVMPTADVGFGVHAFDGTDVAVSYLHGVSIVRLAELDFCALADLDMRSFPLAANKPGTTGFVPAGELAALTQCVPGYHAFGNVTMSCMLGQWEVLDNSFRCQDAAMAQLIADMNNVVNTLNDTIQAQDIIIVSLQQQENDRQQREAQASSQLPALETDSQVIEIVRGPMPRQEGTIFLNSDQKPGVVFGADGAAVFKHGNNLVLQTDDAVVVQADLLVTGSLSIEGVDVLETVRNVSQAIQQLIQQQTSQPV